MIRSSPSFRETSNKIQEKIMLFESNNLRNFTEVEDKYTSVNIEPRRMIPPLHQQQQQQQPAQMPPGVVLDANGLIVPKKLVNPCLESRDRKNLHRELLFSQKIGQPVIKQKSELQKALQKQKDRQFRASMQQEQQERSFQSEFDHMIIERSKRITSGGWSDQQHHQHQQQQQQYYHQQHQQQRLSMQQQHQQLNHNHQFQQLQQQQQQQQHLNQYQYPQHHLHQQLKQQQQQQEQQRPHLLQRQELQHQLSSISQDDYDQLNPEYIKARAKLRVTMDK